MNGCRLFFDLLTKLVNYRRLLFDELIEEKGIVSQAFFSEIFFTLRAQLSTYFKGDRCCIAIPEVGSVYSFKEPYLLGSIEQDMAFLKDETDILNQSLFTGFVNFQQQVDRAMEMVGKAPPDLLISDRDGTLISEKGKFYNSIQSVSDTLILHNLFLKIPGIIISASPLFGHGIADLMFMTKGKTWLAGSNGLECRDNQNGSIQQFRINAQSQLVLDKIYKDITTLMEDEPSFKIFRITGLGLQKRAGQLVIALQDKANPLSGEFSKHYFESVCKIIDSCGIKNNPLLTIRISDTEITITDKKYLASQHKAGLSDILDTYQISLENKSVFVCGNSVSDLHMIDIAKSRNSYVTSLFVTKDPLLQKQVLSRSDQASFVSDPIVLLYILKTCG